MIHVNSRLAARAGVRQVNVVLRAVAAAAGASTAIRRSWRRDLLPLLIRPNLLDTPHRIQQWAQRLPYLISQAVAGRLAQTADWSQRSARWAIGRTVPRPILRAALLGKAMSQTLREDEGDIPELDPVVTGLSLTDLFAPFRNLIPGAEPPADVPDFLSLLFPPFSSEQLNRIVFASGWQARFASASALSAHPQRLGNEISAGLIAGENIRQLAKRLEPLVQGVEVSARRIARTEGLRVAGEAQMETHARLGPLVQGYQIHATLDQNTRPIHRARDGTIYHAEPRADQLGYAAMPHPPVEADGSMAWNCRCFLTPVLRPPKNAAALIASPTFASPQTLAPDPLLWADFFDRADEQRRTIAAGAKRLAAAREVTGLARPNYAHLIDDAGKMLTVAQMLGESSAEREGRVRRVEMGLVRARAGKLQATAMGFV